LSDREFVDRLAGTYAMLAAHPDLAGTGRIGSRLAKAAAAAKAEAKARDVPALDLELETRAPSIADERIIDLTAGEEDDDEREVIEFGLESGRIMRVRPGGLVIRHDRFADVNPFERALAREVASGQTIVVPNQAFVQEARTVLPVRILAQTRVQVYHAAVEAALPGIPGASRSATARHVMERLRGAGARAVVEATVLDWLNVAEHKRAPPERLRPHAPQHWREFRAFMEVVGVPLASAEAIWREGIEPLRIDRRRAGARMAQAFISVLVDPHGGAGAVSPDVKERIARLRRQAMEHLDGVLTVKRPDVLPEKMHARPTRIRQPRPRKRFHPAVSISTRPNGPCVARRATDLTEAKEAVVEGLVQLAIQRCTGEGAEGEFVFGMKPSAKFVSGFLLPR
jgi:hypothetical protein